MKSIATTVAVLVAGFASVAAGQELSQRDRLHIAVQEICPVSGRRLGEHGPPIKVKIGQETLFLCCRGCLQGKVNREHWAAIHANFAKAQQICPVMKKPLPENAKWTIVEGQVVYVCCPPCIDKIAADPSAYLGKLDALYASYLEGRERR